MRILPSFSVHSKTPSRSKIKGRTESTVSTVITEHSEAVLTESKGRTQRSKSRTKSRSRKSKSAHNSYSKDGSSFESKNTPRHTLEKVLESYNPWHPDFVNPAIILCIACFAHCLTSIIIHQWISGKEAFEYICDGKTFEAFDTKDRSYIMGKNHRSDHLHFDIKQTQLLFSIISPLIVFTVTSALQRMNLLSIKYGIICGSILSSCGMFLLSLDTYVWTIMGVFLNRFGVDIVVPLTLALVVESSPKRMRDFAVIMGTVGYYIGHFAMAVLLYYFRNQYWISAFTSLIWLLLAIVVAVIGKESLVHLICTHNTEKAKKRFSELSLSSGVTQLDFDRLIDDVLYSGKGAEPADGLEAIWMGITCWQHVYHIAYYLCIRLVANLELSGLLHPLMTYNPSETAFGMYNYLNLINIPGFFILVFIGLWFSRRRQIDVGLLFILFGLIMMSCVTVLKPIDGCEANSFLIFSDTANWFILPSTAINTCGLTMILVAGRMCSMEHICHNGRLVYYYLIDVTITLITFGLHTFFDKVLFSTEHDPDTMLSSGLSVDGNNIFNFAIRFTICFAVFVWSFFVKNYDSSIVTHNDILLRFGYEVIDMDDSDSEEENEKDKRIMIEENN